MAKGPLCARFHEWAIEPPQAGAVGWAEADLENILLAYHWLDDRGNPIVWDGERTQLPLVAPGERVQVRARVRAPIPPGRYRFSLDLVAEHRAWFSQLGGETADAE